MATLREEAGSLEFKVTIPGKEGATWGRGLTAGPTKTTPVDVPKTAPLPTDTTERPDGSTQRSVRGRSSSVLERLRRTAGPENAYPARTPPAKARIEAHRAAMSPKPWRNTLEHLDQGRVRANESWQPALSQVPVRMPRAVPNRLLLFPMHTPSSEQCHLPIPRGISGKADDPAHHSRNSGLVHAATYSSAVGG